MFRFAYIKKILKAFDLGLIDEKELCSRLKNEAQYICTRLKTPMVIQ